MKQDLKKLICIIFFLAISYLLVWGVISIYYEFSYRIFPVFVFLSTLCKAFFIINIIFFVYLNVLMLKKGISKINYVILIALLLATILLIYFVFNDFLKY